MPLYRDGQQDIGVTIGQVNADNLSVTLEGVSVRSLLHVYDAVGDNWDRLRGTAAGGLLVDTELPTAALLADDTAIPTVPGVGAFGMMFDGVAFDMVRGTAADGLLVNLGTNNDVINSGVFVVQEDGAALTALQLIDDTVAILGTATYLEGTTSGNVIGAVRNDALATLVTLDNEIAPLQVNASGALYIQEGAALDVSAATVTVTDDGSFTLAANSGVDIGDVDVTTMPGTAAEAAALPAVFVVVAGDDGVDTHPLQLNAAGDLKITLDSEAVVLGAGSANIGDVDIASSVALDVSAATVTVDLGANNDVLVDGTVAHDALDSGGLGPVKVGGRAQEPEAQPEEVADNDRVDALFDRNGYLRVRGDFNPLFADINDAGSGDNEIIAAQAAGKRIAVWAILIVSDGTTDVRFEDGADGTKFTGQIPLQAREGYSISAGGIVPLFVGTAATNLNLELTAAVNVHGFVSYTVIDD